MALSPSARADWLDRVAIGASVACLLHCAALPLALAVLPFLGTALFVPDDFHLWMLGLAVPAALLGLVGGRALHGRKHPLIIGMAGLALLATGAVLVNEGAVETAVTIAGGVALALAHGRNARLRRTCCAPGKPAGAAG